MKDGMNGVRCVWSIEWGEVESVLAGLCVVQRAPTPEPT